MIDLVNGLLKQISAFQREAHVILAKHESSVSRVVTLDDTITRLDVLSLRQDDLFRQSLRCIEFGIYRAAHVMAWAGFVDCLEEKIASDGLAKVKAKRTKWTKYKDVEELCENVPEQQIIEAARDVGILSKSECKSLLGLLSRRHECAHPSNYSPNLNQSLGYVSELLERSGKIMRKKY